MLKKWAFLLAIIYISSLSAEILSVRAIFKKGACRGNCPELLKKRFEAMKEISSANINNGTGVATLKWEAGEKYSYRAVKRPMQRVGVGLEWIHVTARGEVKKSNRGVKLVSLDDGTVFELISPVPETGEEFRQRKASATRGLHPDNQAQLLDAGRQGKIVTIDGRAYQPHRSPPNLIILEGMRFEDPKD